MKFKKIIAALILIGFSLVLIGCNLNSNQGDNNSDTHIHLYSDEFEYNDEYHWYPATCGCTDIKKDKYLHVMYENKCIKCGYEGATSNPTVDSVTYKYDMNLAGYVVTSVSVNNDEIRIPSTFNGEEVRGIDLVSSPDANSLYIPSTIISISSSSFSLSDKLVEIYNFSSLNISDYFPNIIAIHKYEEESSIVRLENGLEFVKDDKGEYYLYEYESDSEEVVLPEEINGCEYEILKSAFSFNQRLTRIKITKGVKKFHYGVFENCNNLKELVLPYLGETENKPKALSYLFTIGSLVKLTKLTVLGGEICDNATADFKTNCLLELKLGPNVNSIGKRAFEYCYNITSLVLPEGLQVLATDAFLECTKLVEVYNLSNLTLDSTNPGCPSYYADVVHTFPESSSVLVYQDDFVFYKKNGDLYYLIQYRGNSTDVILPESINGNSYVIASNTFDSVSSVKILKLGNGVIGVEEKAFYNCHIESVKFGNGVTEIVTNTFYNCYQLEDVILDDNIISISKDFAYNCTNITYNVSEDICYLGTENNDYYYLMYVKYTTLAEYTIHNDTVHIMEAAFSNFLYLESILIPNNVLEIKDSTFKNSVTLTNITIGQSVTVIESEAFKGCTDLRYIVVRTNTLDIKENAFLGATIVSDVYYLEENPNINVNPIGNDTYIFADKKYPSK